MTIQVLPKIFICLLMLASAGAGPSDAKQAATDLNQFGCDLLHRLSDKEQGNIFFSPYSLETALTIAYAGARGQTSQEMARVLHLDQSPNHHERDVFADLKALSDQINKGGEEEAGLVYELVTANALWTRKGLTLEPEYAKLAKDQFGAGLEQLDFASGGQALEQARTRINDWVAKQTHDQIKDVLPQGTLTVDTGMVLTNAIYFKAAWNTPFDKNKTKDEPFHVSASKDVRVAMMHRDDHLHYMENAEVQVVNLPYVADRISMLVILPRKPVGLAKLEQGLDAKTIDAWAAKMDKPEAKLSLPKFHFTSHFSLSKVLPAMGMETAFTKQADFSGIIHPADPTMRRGDEMLRLNDVIHQTFVEVNEEATVAAGATGGRWTTLGIEDNEVDFKADHPFLFLIRDDQSGAILFIGCVVDPAK